MPLNTNTKSKVKTTKKATFGGRHIIVHGNPTHFWHDIYHICLSMTWFGFFCLVAFAFVMLNVLFALLYMIEPDGIANLFPDNALGAFFFSVETLATVGYGDMHPVSVFTHFVATAEMFIGLSGSAILTGLIFARFSKPRARILFANSPVMTTVNGQPTLMIRTANARQNFIVDATAKLTMLQVEKTLEGARFRRVIDLKLVRTSQPMFFMGWTIMHVVDESSPLLGLSAADFKVKDISFVLIVKGTDESTTQQMQARQVYEHTDVKWQHRYVDAIYVDADGVSHIDYTLFHDTEALG